MSDNMTTSPSQTPPSDPPRRTFGARTIPKPDAISPASTPLSLSPGEPSHHRTFSSSSTNLAVSPLASPYDRSIASSPFESAAAAADRAQAWLQTWAPRGEGRGREFLSQTLTGVVTVASTVSSNLEGTILDVGRRVSDDTFGQRQGLPRPSSYTATSPPESSVRAMSPPAPVHTTSTPTVPLATTKRPPQPSNLARLGHRPAMSQPPSTTTIPSLPRTASASANLNPTTHPHGPSHLNPHARAASAAGPSHSPSPSTRMGNASPALSRSSSATLTARSAGMPYKVGFQPAGVRSDRTIDFIDERRRGAEEREKQEYRLGRRWLKASWMSSGMLTLTDSSSTSTSTRTHRTLSSHLPCLDPRRRLSPLPR